MLIQERKLYPDREDVTLTAFIINEKGELHGQGKRPGVIICPGGGYFNLSDREAEPIALAFNAMGYHAFILRYSVFLREGEPFESLFGKEFAPRPETDHPAPVRELGMAMLAIREHAEDWQVDMDRIALCGFSAGAHNAAMFGVYWDQPLLTEALHTTPEAIRPAALILCYGLTDYVFMEEWLRTGSDFTKQFFARSTGAFLGKTEFSPEELRAISPAVLVNRNTPPTFLWATSRDGLVPVQHTLHFAEGLAGAGVPFEVHVYEEGDHGLALGTLATATVRQQLNADAAQWIPQAERWLGKRFSLELPEQQPFEF